MSVTTHERPGVYSVYDASAVVGSAGGGKTVGIAAISTSGEEMEVTLLTRYTEAVECFGENDNLTGLVRLLFLNGARAVAAVPVESDDDYEDAFALLAAQDGIGIVTCDSTDVTVQQALRESVEDASDERRERIAVVEGSGTAAQLITRAGSLNSPRVVLAAPGVSGAGMSGCVAAAVAGAIAGETDPAIPLGGAQLRGLGVLSAAFTDSELDNLIRGGVTVAEQVAGETSVVRGVTTKTTTGGGADPTWRELTTVLIIDEVIPGIRNSLRSRFRRAKNTAQSRGAIRSQVIVELENRVAREIITGYDDVAVTANANDPTVCEVEFSFTVAHGLNQIWLTAHIEV